MVEQVKRTVIDEYARELAGLWVENMTASGRLAFQAIDDKREALIKKAEELGIRHEVYARANDIMNGNNA